MDLKTAQRFFELPENENFHNSIYHIFTLFGGEIWKIATHSMLDYLKRRGDRPNGIPPFLPLDENFPDFLRFEDSIVMMAHFIYDKDHEGFRLSIGSVLCVLQIVVLNRLLPEFMIDKITASISLIKESLKLRSPPVGKFIDDDPSFQVIYAFVKGFLKDYELRIILAKKTREMEDGAFIALIA